MNPTVYYTCSLRGCANPATHSYPGSHLALTGTLYRCDRCRQIAEHNARVLAHSHY
ncbi:hypothetical protein [Nocardia gamkensis]|uniref:Uncharacterized protein n=1 Tax=Nocardia gamkensis TaxID=352869 RepID=A0A7X6R5G3_9NOCA|nr:hypothetical protein [Nocardia gamkensis]NKY29438.1 hypothetical protein [Nocardia gamkensis]NQE66961.1 hypothetical protein [Nocardia gamkensis]